MVWTLLEEDDKLRDLLEELRLEISRKPSPTGLRVHGSIRAVLAGKIPEEVVVDEWPEWDVILIRPSSQQIRPDHLLRSVSIHCRSGQSVVPPASLHDVIDWTQLCTFACVPLQHAVVVTSLVGAQGSIVRLIECETLVHQNASLLERSIPVPPPYSMTTVTPQMAAAVISNWHQNIPQQTTFPAAAAKKLVQFNCINFPSSCITDAANKPVAHALCHYYGAVGMLGLARNHKGQGLAALVLHDLCRKLKNEDAQPLWAHIERGNMASAELFVRTGFMPLRGAATVWLEYTPHAHAPSSLTLTTEGDATATEQTPDSPTEGATSLADYF